MLCLTRRPGTALRIGDDVTIYFDRPGHIRIDAPKSVTILRTELDADAGPPLLGTSLTSDPRRGAGGGGHAPVSGSGAGSRP